MTRIRTVQVLGFLILPISFLVSTAAGQDFGSAEKELQKEYLSKVLSLKSCYAGKSVKFGREGTLAGNAKPGGCAFNQSFLVTSIHLKPGQLRLEGDRLLVLFDVSGARRTIATDERISVVVGLDANKPDLARVEQALLRILRSSKDPQMQPPPLPGEFRSDRFDIQPGDPSLFRVKGTAEWKAQSKIDEPIEVGRFEDGEPIYVVSGAVRPPQAIKTPDPDYPESARSQRQDGAMALQVIVDQGGYVRAVRIARSGGPDFDQASAMAVSRWVFKPATLQDKPVAATIRVEMSFHLQ